MDTPHFFSDCVADMEGADPSDCYSERDLPDLASDIVGKPSAAVTPSAPEAMWPNDSLWEPAGELQMSIEAGAVPVMQYFQPALDTTQPSDPVRPPFQPKSSDATRPSNTRTPSSNAPTLRSYESTSASTMTPALTPPAPPEQENQSATGGSKPQARKGRPGKAKAGKAATEADPKRNKFLERNRVAASKCRMKKKEYVSELEEQRRYLEVQNAHLRVEYSRLMAEAACVRDELMLHASCNDLNINRWIEMEARRYIADSTDCADSVSPERRASLLSQPEDPPGPNIKAEPGYEAMDESIDPSLRQEDLFMPQDNAKHESFARDDYSMMMAADIANHRPLPMAEPALGAY